MTDARPMYELLGRTSLKDLADVVNRIANNGYKLIEFQVNRGGFYYAVMERCG